MGMFDAWGIIDGIKDIAVDTANSLKPDQQAWNEKVAAAAREDARADAARDYAQGQLNDDVVQYHNADLSASYEDRFTWQQADAAASSARETPNISLASPMQAAASIMLTPTEIGLDPQDKGSFWSTGKESYQEAYPPAYREEAIHQFDQQLEARFEPNPDAWHDPQPASSPVTDNTVYSSPASSVDNSYSTTSTDSYGSTGSGDSSGSSFAGSVDSGG